MTPVSEIVLARTALSNFNSSYFSCRMVPGRIIPDVWSHVATVINMLMSPVLFIKALLLLIPLISLSIKGTKTLPLSKSLIRINAPDTMKVASIMETMPPLTKRAFNSSEGVLPR